MPRNKKEVKPFDPAGDFSGKNVYRLRDFKQVLAVVEVQPDFLGLPVRERIHPYILQLALADKDNRDSARGVCRDWMRALDTHQAKMAADYAIWQALIKHDFRTTTRFVSSVFRWTHWRCKQEFSEAKRDWLQIRGKTRHRLIENRGDETHYTGELAVEDPGLTRSEQEESVKLILSCLPPGRAKVIRMHVLEGWSLREIADARGIDPEELATRVKSDLAILRRTLETHPADFDTLYSGVCESTR